jgi:hypothetical protein
MSEARRGRLMAAGRGSAPVRIYAGAVSEPMPRPNHHLRSHVVDAAGRALCEGGYGAVSGEEFERLTPRERCWRCARKLASSRRAAARRARRDRPNPPE